MEFHILIVDDDPNMLSVLQDSFSEEHYHVATSSNGLDAIEKCQIQPYDLVISDIMMPGATGLEVLSAAKKINPNTLVILITGFASLETAVSAIREGAYDYITKPFRLEEIKVVVRNALGNIRLRRENQRLMLEVEEAYQKLHLVKRIMVSEHAIDSGKSPSTSEDITGKTVITGNAPPHPLLENRTDGRKKLVSDLERLSRLKMQGMLSEREFELCKSRLLKDRK
ncbi:MAG: response regulator [Desulfatiglandaceae bacterium]|jgi:DNA-binding NtrC family response regulator